MMIEKRKMKRERERERERAMNDSCCDYKSSY